MSAIGRCFVVVSGLPGSGKTSLARQLSSALGLPVLDKDDILERLFDSKPTLDAGSRRKLSRESDQLLETEATASLGAVLVSHWHLPGMSSDSGTPTHWLPELSPNIVNVHCDCDAELAAERFIARKRHPGHLDDQKSSAEIRASIHEIAALGRLEIGSRVIVDTSQAVDLDAVLHKIQTAFRKPSLT